MRVAQNLVMYVCMWSSVHFVAPHSLADGGRCVDPQPTPQTHRAGN
jgi:hypothetical protein